ncbi:MAG: MxaL protein [Burkholderiaceae bacterium]
MITTSLKQLARPGFYREFWLTGLAVLMLSLSVWLPQIELPRNTWNYVITFDISQSMNVRDVSLNNEPVSRLALARDSVAQALRRLPCGSKIGWSIFTEHRTFALLLPLEVCQNYEVLLSALERIDGRIRWRDSSSVGKGLYWAIRNNKPDPDSRIVFLTDGHEAPPKRNGEQLMPSMKAGSVHGWLIGIGSEQASRIPKTDSSNRITGYWRAEDVVQKSGQGGGPSQEHLSSLREPYLQALADFAGLKYQRLTNADALARTLMDKSLAAKQSSPTDIRWIPALLALLLLCWAYRPNG